MSDSPDHPTADELRDLYTDALALQRKLNALVDRLATLVALPPPPPPRRTRRRQEPAPPPPPAMVAFAPNALVTAATAGAEPAMLERGEPAPPPPLEGAITLVLENDPAKRVLLVTNGIEATTGRSLLAMDLAGAAECARSNREFPSQRMVQRLHTQLGVQGSPHAPSGWALVVSANDAAALIEALLPLLQYRATQQQLSLPPLTFTPGETCAAWLARHVADVNRPLASGVPVLLHYPTEEEDGTEQGLGAWLLRHVGKLRPDQLRVDLPFYLLIAALPGHPTDAGAASISFAFQAQLDLLCGVGRICFASNTGAQRFADYRRYAEHVVAHETGTTPQERSLLFFSPQHPGDRLTALYTNEVVLPLAQGSHEQPAPAVVHTISPHTLIGAAATRTALIQVLTEQPPTLLFAAAHGLGLAADAATLHEQQGALICAEWPGNGVVAAEQCFATQDLPEDADLRGMVALLLASYSVGAPQNDDALTYANRHETIAPYAFVGQLAQRLLAQGALAVIGYADRAWGLSDAVADTASSVDSVATVINHLLDGQPLGLATESLAHLRANFSLELTNWLDNMAYGRTINPHDLGRIWVAYQAAHGIVLLGDPLGMIKGVRT